MATAFAPFRALFRATLPLALEPRDELLGSAAAFDPEAFVGKPVLVVGGTRGIGKAIADVLTAAGAKVVIVGRSAVPPAGVAADLSSVAGCRALVDAL